MAMTEARWLRSNRPGDLLTFLLERDASERKLRLYSVACKRLVVRPPEEVSEARNVIAVAERFADGAATDEELAEVCDCRCKYGTWALADPDVHETAMIFTGAGRKEAKQ